MADIKKLIDQLNSDDSQLQLEACEDLAEVPYIPFEGIEALRKLTKNPNRDLADAAQKTLDLQASKSTTEDGSSQPENVDGKKRLGISGWALILLIIFIFLYAIYFLFAPIIADASPLGNAAIVSIFDSLTGVFGFVFLLLIIYGLYRFVRRLFRKT